MHQLTHIVHCARINTLTKCCIHMVNVKCKSTSTVLICLSNVINSAYVILVQIAVQLLLIVRHIRLIFILDNRNLIINASMMTSKIHINKKIMLSLQAKVLSKMINAKRICNQTCCTNYCVTYVHSVMYFTHVMHCFSHACIM